MQRQRSELVPIAETFAGLPGPVQALREDSRQARRGFTLSDQVNQLVSAREADPDRGFMARMMALCSLPRTNTSDFVGSVRCTAPGEGAFTGVAVELDASNQIFTTLPVVPVPEMQDQE